MNQNSRDVDIFYNPLFSTSERVNSPVSGTITLFDLCKKWRSGGTAEERKHIETLRTTSWETPKDRNRYKVKNLSTVCIQGMFATGKIAADTLLETPSHHMALDLDQGSPLLHTEALGKVIAAIPFVKLLARSVGGRSWVALIAFTGGAKRAGNLAADAIAEVAGFELVDRKFDTSRRRFHTFDPSLSFNPDAALLSCEDDDPIKTPTELSTPDVELAEVEAALHFVSPFTTGEEWRKILWGCRASLGGSGNAEARELLRTWSDGSLGDNKGSPWEEPENAEQGYSDEVFSHVWDRSDREGSGSTHLTLFKAAHENGWSTRKVVSADVFDDVPAEEDGAPIKKKRRADFQPADQIKEFKVPWLWPQVIPKGMLTMLAGRQGLGKSFLICDLAARLSIGNALPDGTEHAPMRVLLLAREDVAGCVLVPRLRVAGAALSFVTIATFRDADTGEVLDLVEDIDLVREEHSRKPFGLIVVDTFGAFAGDTDANDQGEVRLFLDALSRLASDTGAAVVVVAHPRKSGAAGGDIMDSIAGSVQMTAGVRVALLLTGDPDTTARELSVAKSNLGARGGKWAWKFKDRDAFADTDEPPRIEWKGMVTAQASLESKLVNAIRDNPEASQRELASVMKVSHGSLVKPFARLRESGMVQEGVALMTTKGEKAFNDGLF